MTYDVGYRFAQALDPSGLDTIAACLHAIQAAAKDCRNAGKPFESDPAVVLLAQHLGAVATTTMPDRPALARSAAMLWPRSRARRCSPCSRRAASTMTLMPSEPSTRKQDGR